MSWSVNYLGTPDKITAALEKQSTTLSGPTKTEFDAALPHLVGLVAQNANAATAPVLKLDASGSSYSGYSSCSVSLQTLGGTLL